MGTSKPPVDNLNLIKITRGPAPSLPPNLETIRRRPFRRVVEFGLNLNTNTSKLDRARWNWDDWMVVMECSIVPQLQAST